MLLESKKQTFCVIVAVIPRNSPREFDTKGVETHSSRFMGGDSSQLADILVKDTLGDKEIKRRERQKIKNRKGKILLNVYLRIAGTGSQTSILL